MHGIRAGRFKQLGEGNAFLNGRDFRPRCCYGVVQRHQRRVVGDVVVFFNRIDQNLNVEIITAGLLDLGDAFGDETGAVFQCGAAIFISTGIVKAGQEMLAHVEAGGIDFKRFKAQLLHAFGDLSTAVFNRLNLFCSHLVFPSTKLSPLIAQAGSVFRTFFDQLFAESQGFSTVAAAISRNFQCCDAFNIDHLHAALSEVDIILKQFIRQSGQVSCRTSGRFHHAVAELQRTNSQR